MRVPDFSIPSENCFLDVDKHGTKIKEGDTLESCHYALRGSEKVKKQYKVTKYEDKLVAIVKPSHLVRFYVETHCEIIKA